MDADPDEVVLIIEHVHVVVARADGTQLRSRHVLQPRQSWVGPVGVHVEELRLHTGVVGATHAEGYGPVDLQTDVLPRLGGDLRGLQGQLNRHVAAGDIEAHARDGYPIPIGSDSTDGVTVAHVTVRAQHELIRTLLVYVPRLSYGVVLVLSYYLKHNSVPFKLPAILRSYHKNGNMSTTFSPSMQH